MARGFKAGKGLGYLAVTLSAASYGISWVFLKWTYQFFTDPLQILALRYLIAVPVMWLLLYIFQRGRLGLSWKILPALLGLGLLNMLTETGLAYSLVFLDAGLLSVLFYTYPVLVSGLAVFFFSEVLNKYRAIALVLIIAGTMLVAHLNPFMPMKLDGLGVALALAGSVGCAFFTIRTQALSAKASPLLMSTAAVTFAALLLQFVRPPVYLFNGAMDLANLPIALILGVVFTASPLFLFMSGVCLVGGSNASIAATLEPVVAVVSGFIILGERMDMIQVLGVISIVAAVTLLQFQREARKEPVADGESASLTQ